MKRLTTLLFAILLFMVGCTNESQQVQFALDKYEAEIPAEGGEVAVRVTSNQRWELTGYTSWCQPSVKSGVGKAEGEVVTFTAESADKDRSITYHFRAGGETFELRISQSKVVGLQGKGQTLYWATPDESTIIVEYESNSECEVIITDEDKAWLSADTRALGKRSATLHTTANNTGYTREAKVIVRATEAQDLSIEFAIRQPSTANMIYYTSTDGKIVEPKAENFKTAITNNILYDGRGIMEFAEPLTEIGDEAFSHLLNPNLKTIILPEGVEHIGKAAFNECPRLEHITLPASLRTIGDCAFQECGALQELTIPDGVTTIGDGLCRKCNKLRKVTMTDSVTSLGFMCFDECGALEEARLSDSITTLPSSTFYYCTSLRKANIPKAAKSIECYAFCACPLLEEATLPEGLTHIGAYAFMSCRSFTEISIPESVTTMDENCFGDCIQIESVTLPESLTELGINAFWACTALREVVIPESLTELASGTFSGCESLDGVVLPQNLKVIGDSAFEGCTSLRSIEIPASVAHINQSTFASCWSLKSVVVRNAQLKEIQRYAFADCYALERVELYATTPPILHYLNIFDGCTQSLAVYVPAESVDTYCNDASWQNYADKIRAME